MGRSNQSRPQRKDKVTFLSNQIRLAGQQGGHLIIRKSCFGSANQKASEHTSDEHSDENIGSVNQKASEHPSDEPKDESSAQPITSFGRIILWRIYKIGRTFGIGQSDHFDVYLTVILRSHSSENLQDRTDFWYRPIRSFRRLFNRYKRSQSPESSSRSDGQTLKPKSLTRKSWTIMSAIRCLRTKSYLVRTSRLERISC